MSLTFSPWQMFLDAGPVVRAVMTILAVASVATWTILVAKCIELTRLRANLKKSEIALDDANTLDLGDEWSRNGVGVAQAMVLAAITERQRSKDIPTDSDGIKERIVLHLERIEAAEGRRLMRGTGVLATIGATAPFIGLFGTVWGIMSAFTGIAAAHATSLAVVAPGIAEALLATALGLIAAIPAVIIYNLIARQTATCRACVADITSLVMRIVSRDLARSLLTTKNNVIHLMEAAE
ncbi:ExbB/TolQ/MotA proton channel family protein [Neokomagataea thailandica NBRC 106555]|uniref:Biopolymer transport protein ExbB n=2 Tax=Neokomagataea TaxID=1223423 RepID=A0A4Y6V8T8_9PROT|nr:MULTISPECIES: tonB-system energizer ExbB [Neokomagataea]QDH24785.1 tonB-system energizer ExbB [Neokomagataea tanensis]GBR52695.1 ExbB/TolQ/MotA proton channel family protein [Neokomagataea thailandica NBRC 106555]